MTRPAVPLSMTVLIVLLAACGGADTLPERLAAPDRQATAWPIAPLIADDGSLMPSSPEAVPADAGARTQAGRYATPAQAAQIAQALGSALVRVAVHGSGAAAVEEAAGIVFGQMAAADLPRSAPVLIDGADLRSAAALVDRLAAQGLSQVWLVTP